LWKEKTGPHSQPKALKQEEFLSITNENFVRISVRITVRITLRRSLTLFILCLLPSMSLAQEPEFRSGNGAVEKLTMDFGMAAGNRSTRTYTEFYLGASAYFSDYFAWRNAFYVHAQPESATTYGLDSSVRWILPFRQSDSGFAIFAGPGLRLPFQGEFAPSLEGGIWLKQGALTFGAGAKSILNTLVRPEQEDDIQFLIWLGLGPTL
jgi:hypothetical protein